MLKKSGDYMVGLLVCHNHKKLNRSGYGDHNEILVGTIWGEGRVESQQILFLF